MPLDPGLIDRLGTYETTAVQYPGVWNGSPALLALSPSRLILIGRKNEQVVNYRAAKVLGGAGRDRTIKFPGVACTFQFASDSHAINFDENLARAVDGLPDPGTPATPPNLLVVTMNDVPGYRIDEVHGDVCGATVRARQIFSNVGSGLRSLVGGEINGFTALLADSRQEARQRMVVQASQLGGNAVVAMRYEVSEIGELTEVACYGTAVTISKLGPVELTTST